VGGRLPLLYVDLFRGEAGEFVGEGIDLAVAGDDLALEKKCL